MSVAEVLLSTLLAPPVHRNDDFLKTQQRCYQFKPLAWESEMPTLKSIFM